MTVALAIAGGGPAALSAARAYREAGGTGAVTLFTPEPDPPYMRPALSKELLRGETDEIGLEDAAFYADHDIGVRHGTTIASLDTRERTLTTADGETIAYATCLIATGAEPTRLGDALALRSYEDGRRLRARAESARTAAVVGSGFIGCEAAASLAMRGLQVTLHSDEPLPQAARLGEEAGAKLANWLREAGVELHLGEPVDDVDELEADLVLTALWIKPRATLAEDAGLAVQDGRIVTDARMRTSDTHVLAAGDVALAHNGAAGRALPVEHWGEALAHGETAGRTAAGAPAEWAQAPGFWSMIGNRTLKYVAWGDGFDEARMVEHGDGAFTVYYGQDGVTVGVLTHERDEDYEHGRELVEQVRPLP